MHRSSTYIYSLPYLRPHPNRPAGIAVAPVNCLPSVHSVVATVFTPDARSADGRSARDGVVAFAESDDRVVAHVGCSCR